MASEEGGVRATKGARNQALWREVNERIKAVAETSGKVEFLCECGRLECRATVDMSMGVRADPRLVGSVSDRARARAAGHRDGGRGERTLHRRGKARQGRRGRSRAGPPLLRLLRAEPVQAALERRLSQRPRPIELGGVRLRRGSRSRLDAVVARRLANREHAANPVGIAVGAGLCPPEARRPRPLGPARSLGLGRLRSGRCLRALASRVNRAAGRRADREKEERCDCR